MSDRESVLRDMRIAVQHANTFGNGNIAAWIVSDWIDRLALASQPSAEPGAGTGEPREREVGCAVCSQSYEAHVATTDHFYRPSGEGESPR